MRRNKIIAAILIFLLFVTPVFIMGRFHKAFYIEIYVRNLTNKKAEIIVNDRFFRENKTPDHFSVSPMSDWESQRILTKPSMGDYVMVSINGTRKHIPIYDGDVKARRFLKDARKIITITITKDRITHSVKTAGYRTDCVVAFS